MEKQDERQWAYLELPKPYVQERENKNQNKKFYSCTIPKGTQMDGTDIGGWKFNAPIVDDPVVDWETMERDPNAKYYSIIVRNQPVKLRRFEKDKAAGEWNVVEMLEVEPKKLRSALQESYKEYKKQQEAEQEKAQEAEKEQEKKQGSVQGPEKEKPLKPKSR